MTRQTISVEANGNRYSAYCFADDPIYQACPTHYGNTPGEAAGKVLAWLVDNNADVSRLEVCLH